MPPPLMAHGAWLMADLSSILEALASAEHPEDICAQHNISMIELIEFASQPEHAALLDKAHALHARQRAMRHERLAALALDKLMDIGLDDTPPANNLEARHRAIRVRALTSVVSGGGRRQSTGGVVRPSGEPRGGRRPNGPLETRTGGTPVPPARPDLAAEGLDVRSRGSRSPRRPRPPEGDCACPSGPRWGHRNSCAAIASRVSDDPSGVMNDVPPASGGGERHPRLRTSTPSACGGHGAPGCRGLNEVKATPSCAHDGGAGSRALDVAFGCETWWPSVAAATSDHGTRARADSVDQVHTRTGGTPVPPARPVRAADPTANPSSPCLCDTVADSAPRAPPSRCVMRPP